MTFKDFNFKENLQKAIDEAGFKEPSPIQIDAIPHILLGKDIVGQAHTGTGKTAAFGLPVLNQLTGKNAEAVVIVPTRELAMQVSDELFKFGKFLGINTATVYGGQSYSRQLKLIETASVIVATPGRFLDLLKNEHIKIKPKFVILDEADEMLDMGFLDDIKDIFTYLPEDRQTLLFSATMPTAIKNLAKTILKEPEFVTITKSDVTNKNITHTGTGKTAAFGLPILNKLECNGDVEAVIIVPTRELAMQVSDEIFKFGKFLKINTATVYGGQSYSRQLKHIENSSVIVATPGRFLDLLRDGKIEIAPKYVVLDEADEMLDMGFLDDIKEIFTFMPEDRQTLLFSATMPTAIKNLAKTILQNPEFITITTSNITNSKITQTFYVVEEKERDDALIRLFDFKNPEKSIIFCRTKKEVDRLSTFLVSQGYMAKALHGDMEQRQREEAIRAFKSSKLEILIATDVAARGLDVNDVTHVFNYHLPFDSESYVHRIGRTGRLVS